MEKNAVISLAIVECGGGGGGGYFYQYSIRENCWKIDPEIWKSEYFDIAIPHLST